MDFTLSEEQQLLQDSARKFLRDNFDVEKRRNRARKGDNLDASMWAQFAELGFLAMPFSEEDGGLGGGVVENMLLNEELGRTLVLEPYLANVLLAGGVLSQASEKQKADYLAPLIEGRLQSALAVEEYGQAFNPAESNVNFASEGSQVVLNGEKDCVLNANHAEIIIVPARSNGDGEPGLFIVPHDAPGVSIGEHRLVNGQGAGRIKLKDVRVDSSNRIAGDANAMLDNTLKRAWLAMGAQALGAMVSLQEGTLEYTKERKQFGLPLSAFQVLQHRMVDMFIACEQFRSLLLAATLKYQEGHEDADFAIHAMKARIGVTGRKVAHDAVQIHGGMGMTDEMAVGHYFKHLVALDLLLGNADQHQARLYQGTSE